MSAIDISNLSFGYDDGPTIIGPIDVHIPSGAITAILGPSGCGKSSLLRLIAGLRTPQTGTIERAGDANALGFVFQDPTLLNWASVMENMMLPLKLSGTATHDAELRGLDILRQLGLDGFQNYLPHQLSGGMRMRLSLARALIAQPKLLLLDEPFAALDEIIRNRLDEELRALIYDRNMTAVFVTHSISESVFLADHILVMSRSPGRIEASFDIQGPRERDINWRESKAFSAYCRTLHELLEDAS